ncbi:hypothetical protein F5Y11DRAFT_313117 [Daldinia sp. FL1419]|nr:hypothetical protein F5Y11DRAFT_313117 [Daldinia sp. FL1419]
MSASQKATTGNDRIRKRLFVFCDGTWKDGVNNQRPLTNVATLARCLQGIADDGYLQLVYYDNGVGNSTSKPAQVIDGVTGRGISTKIRNAYSFISHNYNFDQPGDEIFLVGFSRGAFAVQCLASFIGQTGLLQKQHLYYLRGLFALWKKQNFQRIGSEKRTVERRLQFYVNRFREEELLHQVKIKACAVWDTVSALGLPTPWPRPLCFVGKEIPRVIENAFQALALDETRSQFKPCTWQSKESMETHAKQCWFLGSHTDVGGNGDAALGAVTLIWIIGQLQANTNVTFNMEEVTKHLKHRFLEWNVRINEFLGQFKDTAIYSGLSSSGQSTKPSWYWWLSGVRSREDYLRFKPHDTELNLVHFTVRFAMSEGSTKCKMLKSWETEAQDDGPVQWKSQGMTLSEAELSESRECKEYEIFRAWRDGIPEEPTDRTKFATFVQGLIQDRPEELPGGKLNSFVSLLEKHFRFTNGSLAPNTMYRP